MQLTDFPADSPAKLRAASVALTAELDAARRASAGRPRRAADFTDHRTARQVARHMLGLAGVLEDGNADKLPGMLEILGRLNVPVSKVREVAGAVADQPRPRSARVK